MPNPIVIGQVLTPQYSPGLIALSYFVSFAGSLTALMCASRMFRAEGRARLSMLACAAVALGGVGIWSMHFIGMLAYQLPVRIVYEPVLTIASLLAAVVISGIALHLAGGARRFSRPGWLAGSVLAGLGVCVMHYGGMYAMRLRAAMEFDPGIVALSVGIAITAAAAALWLAFHTNNLPRQIGAAAVMGVAVCTMHYVGMSAATMACIAPAAASGMTLGGSDLVLVVFGVVGLVLLSIFWLITDLDTNTRAVPLVVARRA
ncbi:MAG: histidine kinase [Proteobacteria bacterium]|nr:histidine kinase [Pseudomonadota bacterium]